jgi:hypothetical protein
MLGVRIAAARYQVAGRERARSRTGSSRNGQNCNDRDDRTQAAQAAKCPTICLRRISVMLAWTVVLFLHVTPPSC